MRRQRIAAPRQVPQLFEADAPAASVEVSASLPIAVVEVLGFPIRLLLDLPLPTSLMCSIAGGCVLLSTSPAAPVPSAMPAFVGPEILALALAAEHDRARDAQMQAWIAKKPDWRLPSLEAIGRLGHKVEPRGWSTGQVLHALGLQLDEVWV